MKKIVLHGRLAKEFGAEHHFAVESIAEATRALCANFPGFLPILRAGHFRVGYTAIDCIPVERVKMGTSHPEIHFEPVLAGGGGGGKGKGIIMAVAGIALIATGFGMAAYPVISSVGVTTEFALGATAFSVFGSAITYGNLVMFGAGLLLSGVSTMLTPSVKQKDVASRERPEERPSFLFNGAVNNTEQGGPVPLVYGRVITGSVVVSGGLSIEDLSG